MNPLKKSIIVVLLFGFGLFFIGTDGFQAFTAETARTNDLIDTQPAFPEVTLEDSHERTYSFTDHYEDKYVFITFMYTTCTSVCPQLEMNMYNVYKQLPEEYIGKDIEFLSISFDAENDDPETLTKYRGYFESDGETWRMARIPDKDQMNQLLEDFGVIVIPDGNGHFTHNSAFYLVDRDGYLVDVMDYTKIDEATDKITTILDNEKEG